MSRRIVTFWLIVMPTIFLWYFSLYVSILLRYHERLSSAVVAAHYKAFSIIFLVWLVVCFIHGLFETTVLRRYSILFFNLVSATAVNLFVAIIYFYFQPNLILTPRRFLLIYISVGFVMVLLWYLLLKFFLKNKFREGVYFFVPAPEANDLEHEIRKQSFLGFFVLDHLDETSLQTQHFGKNVSIVLPDNLQPKPDTVQKFYQLRTAGVQFYNYGTFYENLLRRVYLSQLNEMWFLENVNYREKRFYNLVKRMVDIVAGFVIFLVFVVTYPIIAVLIKLDSAGPALFSQKRVGKNGKVFLIYKYRSMTTATDITWTRVNDSRITKIGKILRKTRFDELPQSINLLKGDLSLVGPRPEQVGIVQQLREQIPFYDERHLVKPGAFGWATLNIYAGSLEETKLKLQYDLYYIKHRSFLFDLEIILKTIYYIFTWQGR